MSKQTTVWDNVVSILKDFIHVQTFGVIFVTGLTSLIGWWLASNPLFKLFLVLLPFLLVSVLFILCVLLRPWTTDSRPKYFYLFNRRLFKSICQLNLRGAWEQLFCSCLYATGLRNRPYRGPKAPGEAEKAHSVFLSKAKGIANKITIVVEDDAAGLIARDRVPVVLVSIDDEAEQTQTNLKNFFLKARASKYGSVVTCSRMLMGDQPHVVYSMVAATLERCAKEQRVEIRWIIRTDSCLRTRLFKETLGLRDGVRAESTVKDPFDLNILAPSFIEQKRHTLHGVQYLQQVGDQHANDSEDMIPLDRTDHADFADLGYSSSNLAIWLEKKSEHQKFHRKRVFLVDVETLRESTSGALADRLSELEKNTWVVFDAVDEWDVKRMASVLLDLESKGKRLLLRLSTTGTNLFLGAPDLEAQNQIQQDNFGQLRGPGVIVVGSLTARSRAQYRRAEDNVVTVAFEKEDFAVSKEVQKSIDLIESKTNRIKELLRENKIVVLTTAEWFCEGSLTEYPSIAIRQKVLSMFSTVVKNLKASCDMDFWVMFKGSDTAFFGLQDGLEFRNVEFCGPISDSIVRCSPVGQENRDSVRQILLMAGNTGTERELEKFVSAISKSLLADQASESDQASSAADRESTSAASEISAEIGAADAAQEPSSNESPTPRKKLDKAPGDTVDVVDFGEKSAEYRQQRIDKDHVDDHPVKSMSGNKPAKDPEPAPQNPNPAP